MLPPSTAFAACSSSSSSPSNPTGRQPPHVHAVADVSMAAVALDTSPAFLLRWHAQPHPIVPVLTCPGYARTGSQRRQRIENYALRRVRRFRSSKVKGQSSSLRLAPSEAQVSV